MELPLRVIPFTFLAISTAFASTLDEAARELSRRILLRLSPRETISLEVRGLPESGQVQSALVQNLRAKLAAPGSEAPVAVRVTLNRNPVTYLLVTEIRRGEQRTVLLDPYQPSAPVKTPKAAIALEKKLVWEQPLKILDIAFSGKRMLVLDGEEIAVYEDNRRQSAKIAHELPWPRDLRGRLFVSGSSFEARLPGITCRGALEPDWKAECVPDSSPWLLAPGLAVKFAPGRNYFLSADQQPPIFSAVRVEADGQPALVASLDDGRFLGIGGAVAIGSDLAALDNSCGGSPLVVAVNATGNAVSAYRYLPNALMPVSDPLELNGTLSALWPSEAANAVTAIVHDPESNRHAAYRLSLSCGR